MKFLVFNNKNGLGTADKLIVNWDSVKYIKPIDGDTFYIELNNGAYLEFDLSGANTSPKAIEAINRVVKANPNSRILEVKPRSLTEFVFSNIQYRVAASGSIDGSGAQYAVAVFTDTNTITNLPLGNAGQFLTSGGAGANPTWTTSAGIPYLIDTQSIYVGDVPQFLSGNPQGNTFLGIDAGQYHTTGVSNTAIGYRAMVGGFDGEGDECVFIGYEAGQSNNTEDRNVGIGYRAALGPTSNDNVAVGHNAQAGNSKNVSIGSSAGASLSGDENILIGANAGDALTFGNRNIAIGTDALGVATGCSENVAIGDDALAQNNVSGNWNVGIGRSALKVVTSGQRNVAIGGYFAGDALSTGSNNTTVGFWSLSAEQTGSGNVAIGESALKGQNASTSTSNANIGIGYSAGSSLTTGTNNIVIGTNAQASSATVTNEITLGNSSITVIRAAVTSITSLSDERDKKDIEDLDTGLDFIKSLKPRKFVWNNRDEKITQQQIDEDGNINDVEKEIINSNKGKKDFGFIAQEVKLLDNDTLRLIYDENPDKLEMSYGKLVPILVKAIQELSAKVTALENA
jgi:hypothetical protein